GYFARRMIKILSRRGVEVRRISAERPGGTVEPGAIGPLLDGVRAVFATHVDTSTGVRIDAGAIGAEVRRSDALYVLDGVCSVGGERCAQTCWGGASLLTAPQTG